MNSKVDSCVRDGLKLTRMHLSLENFSTSNIPGTLLIKGKERGEKRRERGEGRGMVQEGKGRRGMEEKRGECWGGEGWGEEGREDRRGEKVTEGGSVLHRLRGWTPHWPHKTRQ